jgi:hypothetical protein
MDCKKCHNEYYVTAANTEKKRDAYSMHVSVAMMANFKLFHLKLQFDLTNMI